jgi:hypothetical protein
MLTEQTDYLQIDIVDYVPIKNSNNSRIVSTPGSRRNQGKNKSKIILLPIPSNISDTNAVRYGSSELNSIAGAAIGGIMDTMVAGRSLFTAGMDAGAKKLLKEGTDAIMNTARSAGGIAGVQGFLTRQLAASAAGMLGANITPSQLLARSTGEILNPNMELLFNGPTLRSFRFSFKMTPRNDIEFLNKFKQCFLENISVNYTADGVYSTYGDGTPVSMIMDLTFKEIEPVYNFDYDKNLSGVGY